METQDFDRVVRHVLPALNLDPEGFRAPRGFLDRARRRPRPSALALSGVDRQLVYVGTLESADPEVAASLALRLAVGSLGAAAEACEQLLVAWTDADGRMCAAGFFLAGEEGVPVLLGSSWTPPDAWPEPMIDATASGDALIETALDRVAQAVTGRGASMDFHSDLERATRLVDLALQRRGGEGQIVAGLPAAAGDDAGWEAWLGRYVRSVRDEWRRATGGAGDRFAHREASSIEGPLAGMHVFLSYARPDAARLAWPTRDALHAAGASVWFDQEESPDQGALDAGLANTIAGCDADVMCASDEFVERAGYATQEIAWALRVGGSRGTDACLRRPGTRRNRAAIRGRRLAVCRTRGRGSPGPPRSRPARAPCCRTELAADESAPGAAGASGRSRSCGHAPARGAPPAIRRDQQRERDRAGGEHRTRSPR